MAKRIFTLSVSIFISTFLFSQDKYIDSLINWLKNHPQVDSQHIITLHRISYRMSERDVQKSFDYYEKVAAYSDSLNFNYGKSLAQINLGLLLANSANFEASNNAYFKAVEEAESCNALRLKAVSLNNIGDNFQILKDYDRCRQYTREAIVINKKLKASNALRGVAINYELLSRCDFEQGLYADAKKNLISGLSYALKSDENYILSQFYVGFAKLFAREGKHDSATWYFNKSLEVAKQGGDLRNEYEAYVSQSQYLEGLSPAKKLVLLDSALHIARRTNYLKGVSDAAQQLSAVYDRAGNMDSSLVYFRIYRAAADSLFSDNNKRNVIIKEAEWMIKRKEIENNLLTEMSALQSRQLAIKNGLLFAVIIVLILAAVIVFFIQKSGNLKKKRNEASFRQKIAETQMQALRAQMNPHFIFNSLTSIENFIMRNDKELASDYLNKFAKLIRMILDSSTTELVRFSKDIEALELYIELEQVRFNNKFTYQSVIDPSLIGNDYNVPPLLIQPFVENAIIHGLAPSTNYNLHLSVSAQAEDDYILYTVEDNGIGRKQSDEYKQLNKPLHKSRGMNITEKRISIFNKQKNADGEVVITDLYNEAGEPSGTKVQVRIKAI